MTIKSYTYCCKAFSEDTMDWGGLEAFKHYTTGECDAWEENDEKPEDGLPLDWAFQKSDEEIDRMAADRFVALLLAETHTAAAEGADKERWEALLSKYE